MHLRGFLPFWVLTQFYCDGSSTQNVSDQMHRTTASKVYGLNYEPCLLCVCAFLCVSVHAHAPPPPPTCVIPLINTSIHSFLSVQLQFSCCSVAVKNISLTVTYIAILATTRTVPVHEPRAQGFTTPDHRIYINFSH